MNLDSFIVNLFFRSIDLGILVLIVVTYGIALILKEKNISRATFYFSFISIIAIIFDILAFLFSYWQNDGKVAAYFNLLYEMTLFFYIPGILNFILEFYAESPSMIRVLKSTRNILFAFILALIVVGFFNPSYIVSLNEPWLVTRDWNIGRGAYGFLVRIRDVFSLLLLISLTSVLVLRIFQKKSKIKNLVLVGALVVNFIFVIDAIYANLFGRFLIAHGVPYPRLFTGLMIFLLTSVLIDLWTFVKKAIAIDKTIEELKASQEKLVIMAYYDNLTGLPNRKNFFEKIEMLCLENERQPRVMGLLFIDFDLFRIANETLGHTGGDQLLKEVVFRIRQSLRSSDLLYRLGGDEFMLVLLNLNSASDAGLVAQKLIGLMAEPFEIDTIKIHLTISIGISVMPRDGRTANELYRKADEALSDAKRDRNTFRFYTTALNLEAIKKISIINSLRFAINKNLFTLYYQPMIDSSGKILNAEALIRLQDGNSVITPDIFIPVAENSGLIQPIGNWVFRQAVSDYQNILAEGFSLKFSINVSPRQLRDGGFVAFLDFLVNENRLSYDKFYLEITETVFLERDNYINSVLKDLFDRNVALVIDDFGTGFSNLSYIRDLPLQGIKIDRSFIQPLQDSHRAAQMVASIVKLAKSLEMSVVAEGVETEFQRGFVFEHGADLCQGFYFARPMPLKEFKEFLKNNLLKQE